jgi:hypothetical protein
MKRVAWCIALLPLALAGCPKNKKTDEQRLVEDLDTFKVHLYLGLKAVAAAPKSDKKVARARKALAQLYSQTAKQTSQASSQPAAELSLKDLAALVKTLLTLRGAGKAELEKGKGSELLLGAAIGHPIKPKQRDHAITLLAMMVAKLHPKAPVPIPNGALLYEAWLAETARLDPPQLDMMLRASQALVFARGSYCDLARKHTDLIAAKPVKATDPKRLLAAFIKGTGLGRFLTHAGPAGAAIVIVPLALELLPPVSAIIAHAQTARCFDKRDDKKTATSEWRRCANAAQRLGVPPSELAFLRAYVAYRGGKTDELVKQLELAKTSPLLDTRARKDIQTLIAHYKKNGGKRGMFAKLFERAFLASFVAKMTHARLQQAGLYDKLAEIRQVRSAHLFARRVGQAMDKANPKGLLDKAKKVKAKGLLDKAKKLLP